MFSREFTLVLNNANQSEQIELSLPGGNPKFALEAFLGGASVAANVLIFEGQLQTVEALGRIVAGVIDAKMVVPRGGMGAVRTDSIGYLTVCADAAIPAGQQIIVTVRLVQIS